MTTRDDHAPEPAELSLRRIHAHHARAAARDLAAAMTTLKTAPLADTPLNRMMRRGHQLRTGHALRAHQEYVGWGVWVTVRECCDKENDR